MAMMMQSGIGFSKIIILVGAGYTSTLLLKNGKLSDILGDLQSLVKRNEKHGESDPDVSDAIAAQVRRLAMEVRQLASSRQITVLNGNSGGKVTSLIVPVTAFGALGYGYMWWKGLSFSDLMYVTKRNMANAVSNLTKHLDHVSDALAATKRHLTQRIENLDGKLDDQVELSKLIRTEVTDVRVDLSQIGYDLDSLQKMVSGLDGKIMSLEDKQDFANAGVLYLCNMVNGKNMQARDMLKMKEQLQNVGKSRGYFLSSEAQRLMGLKGIADSLALDNGNKSITDGAMQDVIETLDDPPRRLMRTTSTKC